MKIFAGLIALIGFAKAAEMEMWDEYGMVSYFNEGEGERGANKFKEPEKGPRMCGGKQIPGVKHGKKKNYGNMIYVGLC